MSEYITEIANDIAKSCPDLVENGCGNDNCVACLAFKLIGLGYQKQEWISVDERLPNPYISVLVYMPDEEPFPTVREGFLTKHGAWYAGGFDRLPDEVVMWKEMPKAPKMKGGAE